MNIIDYDLYDELCLKLLDRKNMTRQDYEIYEKLDYAIQKEKESKNGQSLPKE